MRLADTKLLELLASDLTPCNQHYWTSDRADYIKYLTVLIPSPTQVVSTTVHLRHLRFHPISVKVFRLESQNTLLFLQLFRVVVENVVLFGNVILEVMQHGHNVLEFEFTVIGLEVLIKIGFIERDTGNVP